MARLDPLLQAAAEDVDYTLLAWSLSMSPLERLRAATRAASALGKFQGISHAALPLVSAPVFGTKLPSQE